MYKNRPTLYISIALFLGLLTGYIYNFKVTGIINTRIRTAELALKSVDNGFAGFKDTTAIDYRLLATEKLRLERHIKANEILRDDKLAGFTLLSDIFLRLIKMIVGPLIFTTLVVGVAKVGDINAVGRIGGKTLLWFLSATLVSLLLGMLLVNLFEPGKAIHLTLPVSNSLTGINQANVSITDFAAHIFPKSFFEAMANNEILQIVVFSIFFGVATGAIGEKGIIVIRAMDAIAQVILKMTGYVMLLAPLAVFGAIAAIVAKMGLSIISTYAIFITEFYFSLFILWLIIVVAGFVVLKKRVFLLVNNIKDAMLLAFSTSTSEAAYPKVLMELERFGCNNKVVSFVLPLGYSFNLDGSMMYMTFASLFMAQRVSYAPFRCSAVNNAINTNAYQ